MQVLSLALPFFIEQVVFPEMRTSNFIAIAFLLLSECAFSLRKHPLWLPSVES